MQRRAVVVARRLLLAAVLFVLVVGRRTGALAGGPAVDRGKETDEEEEALALVADDGAFAAGAGEGGASILTQAPRHEDEQQQEIAAQGPIETKTEEGDLQILDLFDPQHRGLVVGGGKWRVYLPTCTPEWLLTDACLYMFCFSNHQINQISSQFRTPDYLPDGAVFSAAAAAGGHAHYRAKNPYAAPVAFGPALGIVSFPGVGLAPSVTPGVTQGLQRNADALDERNVKARRSSAHALCLDFRLTPPFAFPAAGVGPTDVQVGDVNGDCIKDLVAADSGADVVVVFIGCGDGTFFPGVRYPVGPPGSFPYRLELADVNGDKRLDIMVANLGL